MRKIKEYTIKGQDGLKNYSVILCIDKEIIPEKSSCTCLHGSFYRFTKENIKKNNWQCAHIRAAIQKYKNKELDNIELTRRYNGERNEKQIYPIF